MRMLLAALAALALSACAYGSAVDMAPMKARLSQPLVAEGAYCEAKMAGGAWRVTSSDDCVPVTWNKTTRTLSVEDDASADDRIEAAIVSLGSGLYLAQVADKSPAVPFQIHLVLAKGDAFAALPALDDKALAVLASRHPKVIFRKRSERPYIASGKTSDIKAFLKAAAREALFDMHEEGEALSVGVRDAMGAPDHAASSSQVKNIEAILKAARKLAPEQDG